MDTQKVKIPHRITAVVFLAAGAALVGVSVLFDRAAMPIRGTVCLHLGIVTLAVVLLDLIWRFCGGQPIDHEVRSLCEQIGRLSSSIDVVETSHAVGLVSAYSRLGSFGKQDDWAALVNAAADHVDLMGRTLFGWTRAAEIPAMVRDRISEGVRFRVLLMSPTNRWLDALMEDGVNLGAILAAKLEASIKFFRAIQNSLPADLRGKIEIRCFSHTPSYCGIVRIDNRFYITQYLTSASSDNAPFYCVYGTEKDWPRAMEREFEEVWRAATVVDEAFALPTISKRTA